jgi:hypothetical protein
VIFDETYNTDIRLRDANRQMIKEIQTVLDKEAGLENK